MDGQLIAMFGTAAFSGLWAGAWWFLHSAHVSRVEWLDEEWLCARITAYVWYKPWKKKVAVVKRHKELKFTWYFCDEYGEPVAVTVPSEIAGHLVKLREKENVRRRAEARKNEELEQQRYWSDGKPAELPRAKVVNEDH